MAQLLLSTAAAFGSAVSSTVASYAATAASRLLFGPKKRRVEGPRVESFPVQSSTEGAGIIRVYGRARVAGEILWQSRFRETVAETTTRSGKGARLGTKTTTTEYLYSVSLAIGLCEGVVARLGRVWADGKPFDMARVDCRFYRGTEDQAADPLIEAVEGAPQPAYRGLAYIVFEDLPLRDFGNRIPQFTFEIERPVAGDDPSALENAVTGLVMIPAAGEFAYGTTPVLRRERAGVVSAENQAASPAATDFTIALDAAVETFPNLARVSLAVAWFGTSTDAGACAVRPGVETAEKETEPYLWRAGGVDRAGALLVSRIDGAPAYGGTPADRAVVEAIVALKARGLDVMFHPFLLMDAPGYPWRGRIGVGAADKTAGAATKIANFFGTANAAHFPIVDGVVQYGGPAEWSFRRFILHCAHLCAAAGGVESFLLGSELVGVTTARSGASTYPAVAALRALAAEVRAVLGPATKISYGADWTEWRGHQPADGSGDVCFHLDPLWADAAIDFVGVDMYAPRADWRDGAAHRDALLGGPYDRAYLSSQIEGGEGYDWYYGSHADRAAQTRRPITDGAHGEPWVFRVKDVRDWWSRAHHDRPGGVRAAAPTAWTPRMKPIRFAEFGAAAIDKAANQPNVFGDPKSVESGRPWFSSGARDDLAQRRLVEAEVAWWADGARNPQSSVYGGPMIEALYAYCWDARPYPFFPARRDLWGDAANWERGHWLNGRAGRAALAPLVARIATEGGAGEVDASSVPGTIAGVALQRPMSARDALEPFAEIFAIDGSEGAGGLAFRARGGGDGTALDVVAFAAREKGAFEIRRAEAEDAPSSVRLAFLDEGADYRPSVASASAPEARHVRQFDVDLGAAMTDAEARARAAALLAAASSARETAAFELPPSALAFEPGDVVRIEGRRWRIVRIEDGATRRIEAERLAPDAPVSALAPAFAPPPAPSVYGAPLFAALDLPRLGDEAPGLWFAAFSDPWPGAVALSRGEETLAVAGMRAVIGELAAPSPQAGSGRFDRRPLRVRLAYGAFESVDAAALLAGANRLAIETAEGFEVLQFSTAALGTDGVWTLSTLLRGQAGTERQAAAGAPAGARVVLLTPALARAPLAAAAKGETLALAAGPLPAAPGSMSIATTGFVFRARSETPLSPVHLRTVRTSDGIRLSWIRRTRIAGEWWDQEAPVGEAFERYRLRILDGASVKRTVEVAAPAWVYASAEIVADFGSASPPAGAAFEVAQLSDMAGEGEAARAIV